MIAQRLNDASPFVIRDVDVANCAVGKCEAQRVVGDQFDSGDVDELLHLGYPG